MMIGALRHVATRRVTWLIVAAVAVVGGAASARWRERSLAGADILLKPFGPHDLSLRLNAAIAEAQRHSEAHGDIVPDDDDVNVLSSVSA
jgi:DNA-binding response OmpR family regulator